MLRDWELLILLNQLGRSDQPTKQIADSSDLRVLAGQLIDTINDQISSLANMMTRPRLRNEGMLVPE